MENTGNGRALYENQEPVFRDVARIFVGLDLTTGYYHVEGSGLLWDELCAFRGLDAADLENFVCVAQYVESLRRFGRL